MKKMVRTAHATTRALFVIGLAAIAACDSSTAPPKAVTIVFVGDVNQAGIVGEAISPSPMIEIRDDKGTPLANIPFTVSVTGGGTITGAPTKTVAGSTSLGTWTLGTTVGTQSVTVQSGSLPSLTISAMARAGAPSAGTSGGVPTASSGSVGAVSVSHPQIKLTDAFGNPVQAVPVLVAVTGGGSVQFPSPLTNSAGLASVGNWTLGSVAGTQTVTLSAAGLASPVVFTATVEAGPATAAVAVGATNSNGTVSTASPIVPSIKVTDAFGNGIAGINVSVSVGAQSGSVGNAAPVTNASGVATVGSWTLGSLVGAQTVQLTAPNLPAVTFTVNATGASGGTVSTISVNAGRFQTGAPSTALAQPVIFRATTVSGAAVAGATMQFTVLSGGGSITTTSVVTDASGLASPGTWTLGSRAGAQTLRASVGGITSTAFATAMAPAGGTFDIDVRYVGTPPSTAIQAAFTAAVNRIRTEIVADISNVAFQNQSAAQCYNSPPVGVPILNETVDDLVILVNVTNIDGISNVLAFSGPCFLRSSSGLPALGTSTFDLADINVMLANGTLNDVVLHEFHHVLGYGTMWQAASVFGFNLIQGAGTSNPFYLGAAGNAAYAASGGSSLNGIPIENQGAVGDGTRDGHWRESIFGNEVLTGFSNVGVPNPLSAMSVAQLGDFGYAVNASIADAFIFPTGASRASIAMVLAPLTDQLRFPQFLIDASGRTTPIPASPNSPLPRK